MELKAQILSPQRKKNLKRDHAVTQLIMSWIWESQEETAEEEGKGLENTRGQWCDIDCLYQEGKQSGKSVSYRTNCKAGVEKSLRYIIYVRLTSVVASHYLRVKHMHVCVRGENADS